MNEPRCIRCDKEIESAAKDADPWEMALDAVLVDGGGSFGSALYDTLMDGISIRVIICDECLRKCEYKVKEIKRDEAKFGNK